MTIFRKIKNLEKTFLKIENEEPVEGDLFFVEGEFFMLGPNYAYIPVDFIFSVETETETIGI